MKDSLQEAFNELQRQFSAVGKAFDEMLKVADDCKRPVATTRQKFANVGCKKRSKKQRRDFK